MNVLIFTITPQKIKESNEALVYCREILENREREKEEED